MSDGQTSKRDVVIRPFEDRDAHAFSNLNREWIEAGFTFEESDQQQLENPIETIVNPGGFIAVAEMDGRIVAVGGLMLPHHTPDDGRKWYEIVKMATLPEIRGQGLGGLIIDRLIAEASRRGAYGIWLETNAKLVAAVALYEKRDFESLEENDLWPTPYERCNLQMVLKLKNSMLHLRCLA